MATTLPGTTVEVSRITPGLSRRLFDGMFAGERYLVYINAADGEAEEILRVTQTQDGETAI